VAAADAARDHHCAQFGGTDALRRTVQALVVWTEQHQNEIAAAHEAYDRRVAAG